VRSYKNLLIFVLLVTTAGLSAIAWRQYNELVTLRPLAIESATVPAKVDHPVNTVAAEAAAAESKAAAETEPTEPRSAPEPFAGRPEAARENAGNFMRMMEQPEVQRLRALLRKGELDTQYSALFRSLNLTPAQLDAFKNLLVEKTTALMDVRAAAREQGISPRSDPEAYRKLVADTQAQIDEGIRAQLGDAGYAQYKSYEQTQPQRAVVSQLEQRLSYTSTPLTQAQSTQLVNLLAGSTTPSNSGRSGIGMGNPNARAGRVTITDTTINQSLGVLAAPQVDALRQIQQEQQLQAQLNAAMRAHAKDARRAGAPAAGETPVASPHGG
jgi:hypothetical protein